MKQTETNTFELKYVSLHVMEIHSINEFNLL